MKAWSILIFIATRYIFVSGAATVVHIQNGSLKGTTITSPRSNRSFYAFLGIPYAKPPIGDLRFKPPQPIDNWSGLRDATQEGSICLQCPPFGSSDIKGDENCLFLNIVTPQIDSDSLKPVMVWIHGGAFFFGSGSLNAFGPNYLMDHDIVFVSINYRLGALGFLCLENEEVSGNAGMKDQVLALKWVQENIRQFGGDPNKVTIVGESAGGASVHYHILSPMSRGLFHGAISESGSSLNPWAFNVNCSVAFDLGESLGIITEDKTELVNQLRTFTGIEIANASGRHFNTGNGMSFVLRFAPSLDTKSTPGDIFLPDTAINIFNSGLFNKVPYITGINSAEGIVFLGGIKKSINKSVEETIRSFSPEDFGIDETLPILEEARNEIRDFYFTGIAENYDKVLQYINLTSDVEFFNGIFCTAIKHTILSTAPVYFYEFSYDGEKNTFKKLFGGSDLAGASHVDELPYLFRMTKTNFELGSEELLTSERMIKMWTNFIKTGNPTPEEDPLLQNITWLPVSKTDSVYLNIDTDLSLQFDMRKPNACFWKQLHRNYSLNPLC